MESMLELRGIFSCPLNKNEMKWFNEEKCFKGCCLDNSEHIKKQWRVIDLNSRRN